MSNNACMDWPSIWNIGMIFPLVMGVIIGGCVVFFLFLAIFAYSPEISQIINPLVVAVLKDVAGPVAAGFGGAISGAACSYMFQQKIERDKEVKSNFTVVHRAVIHLSQQLNDLFSVKKYIIYPSRESQIRFLDISKIPSNPAVAERVDPSLIDVVLSLGDASTIDTIYLAEARYRACFENFANRNVSLDEYRASLKRSDFGKRTELTLCEIYSVVGEGQLIALHIMTEEMIEVLDEALQTLSQSLELLSNILKVKYKGSGLSVLSMSFAKDDEYLKKLPPPYFEKEALRAYLRRCD